MEKENQKILTAEIKPFLVDYLAYARAVIETRNGNVKEIELTDAEANMKF